jgi:hypothetical protein
LKEGIMICTDGEPYLRTKIYLWLVFFAPLLGLLSIGCGDPSGEISGKVNFKGKPLTVNGAVLSFVHPTRGSFAGNIGSDGSYTVSKVPLGQVKIAVMLPRDLRSQNRPKTEMSGKARISPERWAKMSPDEKARVEPGPPPPPVSLHYSDHNKSGLEYTVTEGRQIHDIDLK